MPLVSHQSAQQSERTRDRLLLLLKERGMQCAAQLSEQLGLTQQGVRRHLLRLTEDGLIEASPGKPLGRGRVQQVYRLTEQGEARFPKSYPSLCVDILEHLQAEYGSDAVERVISARAQTAAQRMQTEWAPGLSLAERIEAVAHGFREAGYDSYTEESGEFYYLTHRNCPHLTVARQFMELCQSERAMIEHLLGTEVRSETRAATGACDCRYRIRKDGAAPAPMGRMPH
ncbi:transcriptional regulator [Deinococcus piscis]|uniref:Transcriptional regulator n=1 Tax=Deinococcus piscis TaxID=394230 RepID=A0ABQ3K8Y7_9DEIO|nr:transcriptional regulator [Deinococcus piscis]